MLILWIFGSPLNMHTRCTDAREEFSNLPSKSDHSMCQMRGSCQSALQELGAEHCREIPEEHSRETLGCGIQENESAGGTQLCSAKRAQVPRSTGIKAKNKD